MPKKIQKPFCTMFKRSDFEKKTYEMAWEFEEQKREIEELKKKVEELSSKGRESNK